jgi:hypothetical protein
MYHKWPRHNGLRALLPEGSTLIGLIMHPRFLPNMAVGSVAFGPQFA